MTEIRSWQYSNAEIPIVVTLFGIDTDVALVLHFSTRSFVIKSPSAVSISYSDAPQLPSSVTSELFLKLPNEKWQPSKALPPIDVTLLGITRSILYTTRMHDCLLMSHCLELLLRSMQCSLRMRIHLLTSLSSSFLRRSRFRG